jgi:hypothetical protein
VISRAAWPCRTRKLIGFAEGQATFASGDDDANDANPQTGYMTSQAIRNPSGVNPPATVMTPPNAARTNSVERKPPRFAIACATPMFRGGFDVRAMSRPMTEPGPPTARESTRTTSIHTGAVPGAAKTSVHTVLVVHETPRMTHDRYMG